MAISVFHCRFFSHFFSHFFFFFFFSTPIYVIKSRPPVSLLGQPGETMPHHTDVRDQRSWDTSYKVVVSAKRKDWLANNAPDVHVMSRVFLK